MTLKAIDWTRIREDIFPFSDSMNLIKKFLDLNFLPSKYEPFYSTWFKDFIGRAKQFLGEFVESGYSQIFAERVGDDYKAIRKLAVGFSNNLDIHRALFFAIGWRGKMGLELASAEIRYFQHVNGRTPFSTDTEMKGIISALICDNWKELGITSWHDVLVYVFGEKQLKIWEMEEKKVKLNQAISILKQSYSKTKKLPRASDVIFCNICDSCTSGIWKEFGVSSWNDLLMMVFGEVTLEKKFARDQGLEQAVDDLTEFYDKNKRMPTKRDFSGIAKAILKGFWVNEGIRSWNGLLLHVFGCINKEEGNYQEENSLEKVIGKLLDFEKYSGRAPTSKDRGMRAIIEATRRGTFAEQGIRTWNELLQKAFGRFNRDGKKYLGYKGLKIAFEELGDLVKNYGNIPNCRKDMVARRIYEAVTRGNWRDQGVMNWNELKTKFWNTRDE